MADGLFRLLWRRYGEVLRESWRHRHDMATLSRTREEASFLPPVLEVMETPPPRGARLIVWVIMLFLVLAVLWSILGKTDIVASAAGKIIPDERIKVVQAVESGKIREIRVRDGDFVRRGDVLLLLDATVSEAEHAKAKESWRRTVLEEAVAALLITVDFASPSPLLRAQPSLAEFDPSLVEEYQSLLDGLHGEQLQKLGQFHREMKVIDSRLAGTEQQLAKTRRQMEDEKRLFGSRLQTERGSMERMEQMLPLVEERLASHKSLWEKGVIPRMDYLQEEEKMIETRQQLRYHMGRVEEIKAEERRTTGDLEENIKLHERRMSELRAELEKQRQAQTLSLSSFRREMLNMRTRAQSRMSELKQELIQLSEQLKATRIVSPIDGQVQQLAVHTIGGVLEPAQALMVIVPAQSVLESEVRVENKDIGFVREGQKVEIKVDTFSYTKYGLIEGEVLSVSRDAIEDERMGLVYLARIRLLQTSINVNGRQEALAPGMSVVAEIKIGERRVIEFFLSPLVRHWRESFDER